MILPIPLLQTARDYLRFQSEQTVQLAAQLHNHVYAAMTGSLVLAVLAGAVIPMAVYAYLMTPRSVGLMHALPVTRTSQFFTHFLSGFGLLTAGNLLIFLLSALAMMPSGSVDWAALGLWLLVTELLELFFLSLGALCAMATGCCWPYRCCTVRPTALFCWYASWCSSFSVGSTSALRAPPSPWR